MPKWSTGVKRVAGTTYRVVKQFGAWLIMKAGKLVAAFVNGVIYTFGREMGRQLARRVFAA